MDNKTCNFSNFSQTSGTCPCLNLHSMWLSACLSTLEVYCPSLVTNTDCPFRGKCFNCKREGHIVRDCTTPKRSRINIVQIDEWAAFEEESQGSNQSKKNDRLTSSIWSFTNLSLKEKQEFVAMMSQEPSEGEQQDFQRAWSVWPWLGHLAWNMYTCWNVSLFQYKFFYTCRAKGPKPPLSWIQEQRRTSSVNNTQSGCNYRSNASTPLDPFIM